MWDMYWNCGICMRRAQVLEEFLVRQSLEQKEFWCLRSFCSGLYFVLLKGGYDRIDRSIYSELILVLQTFRCVGVLGYFSY